MLYLAFQRSPYPHAKIISIDSSKAKSMAGVELVITGDDLGDKLNLAPSQVLPNMIIPAHPVLARGAVHCVGVPVAAVAAKTRAQAEDAAHAIIVEYEALPGVSNAEDALKAGAPLVHQELDSNVCYTMTKNGGESTKPSPPPTMSSPCISPARARWRWRWSRAASPSSPIPSVRI